LGKSFPARPHIEHRANSNQHAKKSTLVRPLFGVDLPDGKKKIFFTHQVITTKGFVSIDTKLALAHPSPTLCLPLAIRGKGLN
jgi:hypothetical protein